MFYCIFMLYFISIYWIIESKEDMIQKLYWENNFIIFSITGLILDLMQTGITAQPSVWYPDINTVFIPQFTANKKANCVSYYIPYHRQISLDWSETIAKKKLPCLVKHLLRIQWSDHIWSVARGKGLYCFTLLLIR